MPSPSTHTLPVSGGRLYYEVRGNGPLLLVVGSPMDASHFAPFADALASDRTVVTHDPRGISRSALDDPAQDSTPELRADDVAALLVALGAGSADVFGSSGGAVTGLALAVRHPGRVRTLVAHEPPLFGLLPDAAARHAEVDDIVATYHRDGVGAAWAKFMSAAGFDTGDGEDDGAPVAEPSAQPSAQDLANSERFFAHELLGTTRYLPDIPALTSGPSRIVVGIGAESGHLATYRTSTALADRLGTQPVEFPGDHGGFLGAPRDFADALRKVLTG
ncbi:alpha/beta fold hydrolase [Streptomyces sp. NPDC004111]|uniref:alpha/beta fold hydrolase n=1 Tax=Streptomyces sp. NPDC004111 TaxID=3364690 RepID=UPI00367F378C